MAKAREYGVLEGAVKVAAVLSREDELCTMNTMDRYNHPDGDIMSLLQAIDLVEGILKTFGVTDIKISLERVSRRCFGNCRIQI